MPEVLIPLAMLAAVIFGAVRLFRRIDRRIDQIGVHPDDRPPRRRRRGYGSGG